MELDLDVGLELARRGEGAAAWLCLLQVNVLQPVYTSFVCVSECVCACVCNFGWMNGRMKLEVHRRIRVQTPTHPHIHTPTHPHIHTHTGARTRTFHPQPQWPRLGEPPDPSPFEAAVHLGASCVAHACMHTCKHVRYRHVHELVHRACVRASQGSIN